jgi:hypothetical protein
MDRWEYRMTTGKRVNLSLLAALEATLGQINLDSAQKNFTSSK